MSTATTEHETMLLTGREVDRLFRWPNSRAVRLARAGKLASVELPDGTLRFRKADIMRIVRPEIARGGRQVEHAMAGGGGIERR